VTPGGRRWSASSLDVTVPVVTTTLTSRLAMRPISGSALASSPTLAACSQTRAPLGRRLWLMPRRSSSRAPFYLPRLSRRDNSSGANGAATDDNSR
jgi:hypothetical protein